MRRTRRRKSANLFANREGSQELKKMKRLSTLIVAITIPVAFAASALAQESKTLGTVVNGNTTTVFKAAGPGGIDSAKLKTWNDFAAQHPKVANDLANKPEL